MNDQLIMNNYLLLLKSTMEVYVHGTLESSNSKTRDLLKLGLDETVIHQAKTYDEMTKYDWYSTNNVKSSTINTCLRKIKSGN